MPAAFGFVTFGRRILPGMEKPVTRLSAGMAILAAVGRTHFLVASHAADVIRSLEPDFITVIQSSVSIDTIEIFSFEPLDRMAALVNAPI